MPQVYLKKLNRYLSNCLLMYYKILNYKLLYCILYGMV